MLLAIGSTVCTIFGPKILGQMTDTAVSDYGTAIMQASGKIPDPETLSSALNWTKLGNLALLLIFLFILSGILNYIEGVLLSIVSAHYAKKMRSRILDKISRLPISYFDRHQFGDTLSRMSNDVSMVSNTLTDVLSRVISSVTMLVGILIMMMTISFWLSIIALVAVLFSLIFVALVAKKSADLLPLSTSDAGQFKQYY